MKNSLQIVVIGGKELNRIVEGLRKYPCQEAIFISSSMPETVKTTRKLTEKLSLLMRIRKVTLHYHNLKQAINFFMKLYQESVQKHQKVYVNISEGTKIIAIAAVIAAQYYSVQVIYAVPAKYTQKGVIRTKKVKKFMELPIFQLRELLFPKRSDKEFLKLITGKMSFTELMRRYANKPLSDLEMRNLKSRFFYTIKKMERNNLIKTMTKNRQLFIQLSETGKILLKVTN